MSENKKRPTGRKRGEVSSSSQVSKGEKISDDKVGNVEHNQREFERESGLQKESSTPISRGIAGSNKAQRKSSSSGNNLIRYLLLFLIIYLAYNAISSYFNNNSEKDNSSLTTNTSASFARPDTTYESVNSTAVSATVSSDARAKYTQLKGDGSDKVTIMLYMCATDLESNYGMATSDLNEILYADQSDNVELIIQTGGNKTWQNSVLTAGTSQRWRLAEENGNKGLVKLEDLGRLQMTDPNNLSDFIKYCARNYPADRYILILWDHGGGSLSGYGYDEYYPNGTMTLDEIDSALSAGGVKFDFIGFDACLMATVETALVCEKHADYLLASEETEPGTGWYYTSWLNALNANSSLATTDLAKTLIDDFIAESLKSSPRESLTLSLIDLADFAAEVPSALEKFASSITTAIENDDYTTVANARKVAKEFASSSYIDQIDLTHFALNVDSSEAKELVSAIESCVKYNRTSNMKNAYGMSAYFPYYTTSNVSSMVTIYQRINMSSDYITAVKSFATLQGSGQLYSTATSSSTYDLLLGGTSSNGNSYDTTEAILELLLGGYSSSSSSDSYSLTDLLGGSEGYDNTYLDLFSSLLGSRSVDSKNLKFSEVDGETVLILDEDQWSLINEIALNVWVDDGSGYIDLGYDNLYDFDANGNLIAAYDGAWVAVNNQAVAYYVNEYEDYGDGTYLIHGYIPALINGERANFIVEYDQDNLNGTILGARKVYESGEEAKGYLELNVGDEIQFLCDYYDYNGNFEGNYTLGEKITLDYDGLTIGATQLSNNNIYYGYVLSDVYNAKHWTPMRTY